MKLAVSNIGWPAELDGTIAPRLRDAGAEAIEVAPGRLFDDPANADLGAARALAQSWADAGLPIVSMQALLFGQGDLRLLGGDAEQDEIVAYLSKIIALAGALGCGPLVFGSPRNRARGQLSFDQAKARALPVLRRIGDIADANGCCFCLEANATGYGCDFMTVLAEAAEVARASAHSGVGLILDTGNMAMESEPATTIAPVADLIRHVHFSAPQLGPILPQVDFVSEVMQQLHLAGYQGHVTLEMRGIDDNADTLLRCVSALRDLLDRG